MSYGEKCAGCHTDTSHKWSRPNGYVLCDDCVTRVGRLIVLEDFDLSNAIKAVRLVEEARNPAG